jgi:hypothetical protein
MHGLLYTPKTTFTNPELLRIHYFDIVCDLGCCYFSCGNRDRNIGCCIICLDMDTGVIPPDVLSFGITQVRLYWIFCISTAHNATIWIFDISKYI